MMIYREPSGAGMKPSPGSPPECFPEDGAADPSSFISAFRCVEGRRAAA